MKKLNILFLLKKILPIVIVFVFGGCQPEKQAKAAKGEITIVPVENSLVGELLDLEGRGLNLSSFVNKIDIIPLEFTDDCILSEIKKVVIYENNIFILEHFSQNGCKI